MTNSRFVRVLGSVLGGGEFLDGRREGVRVSSDTNADYLQTSHDGRGGPISDSGLGLATRIFGILQGEPRRVSPNG